MKEYFFLEESPYYEKKYTLRLKIDELPFPNGTSGSYGVLMARLLNLSYIDALRYVRDRLGADLMGKGHTYIVPYFENTPVVQQFVKLLNRRLQYTLDLLKDPYIYTRDENNRVARKEIEIK